MESKEFDFAALKSEMMRCVGLGNSRPIVRRAVLQIDRDGGRQGPPVGGPDVRSGIELRPFREVTHIKQVIRIDLETDVVVQPIADMSIHQVMLEQALLLH